MIGRTIESEVILQIMKTVKESSLGKVLQFNNIVQKEIVESLREVHHPAQPENRQEVIHRDLAKNVIPLT